MAKECESTFDGFSFYDMLPANRKSRLLGRDFPSFGFGVAANFKAIGDQAVVSIANYFRIRTTPNPHQSKRQKLLRCAVHSVSDQQGNGSHGQSLVAGLPWLFHAGLRRMPLMYGFLLELRNLSHRMRLRYKQRYDLYGVDLGPWHQLAVDGHLEPNIRTHACTQDIKNFVDGHRWATMIDVEMYRDAWERGAVWVESSLCKSVRNNLALGRLAQSERSSASHPYHSQFPHICTLRQPPP